jgi:DNA-binding transcriptional ArsR family regulator
MHRIHFTTEDLAKVRIEPSLGPLAEAQLSLAVLRRRGTPMFDGFRERARTVIDLRREEMLDAIAPGTGPYFFDLISLAGLSDSFDQTAEALLAAPRQHMSGELVAFGMTQPRHAISLRDLPNDLAARRHMVGRLDRYHSATIAPQWSRIRGQLDADRLARGQILADRGLAGLLGSLHSRVRWEPPCLLVDCDGTGDTYLDGRGLVLAPTFFWREPTFLRPLDDDEPCMLIYPAPLDLTRWAANDPGTALANLLGRTRATVLRAISEGPATTTHLANRLGTSAATISQHTAVLREAGLITSHRYRNTVRHVLTTAGAVLLDGDG